MSPHSPILSHGSPRYAAIDALRGAAMVWMTAFHFGFDLAHFGLWNQNFRLDPFWTLQRTAIVSLFLFCAGFSQAMAVRHGKDWTRFWKRWAQIAGCAVLVSVGSYAMFPTSFIYFGVLHGMAVMLIVARLTYLDGTELDFVKEGLNEGFKFNNPNVRGECGCGESFNI